MQSYNFINYIHVVDMALLNFIDYSDLIEGACLYGDDGKIHLTLNAKTKKFLTSFIVDNINNMIHYGKTNVILNTCKPMKNWRQTARKSAVRNYKYSVMDESVYVDELKLNNFADYVFKKLPTMNFHKLNSEVASLGRGPLSFKCNVFFVEFDTLDIYDISSLAHSVLSSIGSVSFDLLHYNVIRDGNHVYDHAGSCPAQIIDLFRLSLTKSGLI